MWNAGRREPRPTTIRSWAISPSNTRRSTHLATPIRLLIVYTTEPGSADETSLRLLANWHDGERRHSTLDTRS